MIDKENKTMYGDKNTIKDKLPIWWKYGDPLYYCEEDDTLWTSQKEVSIHWYDIRINNVVKLLNKARNEAAEHLAEMNRCKSMYPVWQKAIDRANERLKVLLASRNWRETNDSHADKKREVVTLQYKRYEWLDKLHEEQKVFAERKVAYKRAKKSVAEFEEMLKDYQTKRDAARRSENGELDSHRRVNSCLRNGEQEQGSNPSTDEHLD